MSESKTQENKGFQKAYNLTMAGIAGQVGFLTLGIIFVALFGGLWIDKTLDSKPMFTIILLLASVPVTLFLMFRVVKTATSKIKPTQDETLKEDQNRE